MDGPYPESRQERRGKKLQAERERMAKHGKGTGQVYKNALLKRAGKRPPEDKAGP